MSTPVRIVPATPTVERCVSSHPARGRYRLGVIYPPEMPGSSECRDTAADGVSFPGLICINARDSTVAILDANLGLPARTNGREH